MFYALGDTSACRGCTTCVLAVRARQNVCSRRARHGRARGRDAARDPSKLVRMLAVGNGRVTSCLPWPRIAMVVPCKNCARITMLVHARLLVVVRMIVLCQPSPTARARTPAQTPAKSMAQQAAANKHAPGTFPEVRLPVIAHARSTRSNPGPTDTRQRTLCTLKLSKNASRRRPKAKRVLT